MTLANNPTINIFFILFSSLQKSKVYFEKLKTCPNSCLMELPDKAKKMQYRYFRRRYRLLTSPASDNRAFRTYMSIVPYQRCWLQSMYNSYQSSPHPDGYSKSY